MVAAARLSENRWLVTIWSSYLLLWLLRYLVEARLATKLRHTEVVIVVCSSKDVLFVDCALTLAQGCSILEYVSRLLRCDVVAIELAWRFLLVQMCIAHATLAVVNAGEIRIQNGGKEAVGLFTHFAGDALPRSNCISGLPHRGSRLSFRIIVIVQHLEEDTRSALFTTHFFIFIDLLLRLFLEPRARESCACSILTLSRTLELLLRLWLWNGNFFSLFLWLLLLYGRFISDLHL